MAKRYLTVKARGLDHERDPAASLPAHFTKLGYVTPDELAERQRIESARGGRDDGVAVEVGGALAAERRRDDEARKVAAKVAGVPLAQMGSIVDAGAAYERQRYIARTLVALLAEKPVWSLESIAKRLQRAPATVRSVVPLANKLLEDEHEAKRVRVCGDGSAALVEFGRFQ